MLYLCECVIVWFILKCVCRFFGSGEHLLRVLPCGRHRLLPYAALHFSIFVSTRVPSGVYAPTTVPGHCFLFKKGWGWLGVSRHCHLYCFECIGAIGIFFTSSEFGPHGGGRHGSKTGRYGLAADGSTGNLGSSGSSAKDKDSQQQLAIGGLSLTGCMSDFSVYIFHPYGAAKKQGTVKSTNHNENEP